MDTIKVVLLPYEKPVFKIVEIENSLQSLQEQVGGLIECETFNSKLLENNLMLVFNEEGKFNDDLQPCIVLVDKDFNQLDSIVGNVLICGFDEDGDFSSLTDEQIASFYDIFKGKECDGRVMVRKNDGAHLPILVCD